MKDKVYIKFYVRHPLRVEFGEEVYKTYSIFEAIEMFRRDYLHKDTHIIYDFGYTGEDGK